MIRAIIFDMDGLLIDSEPLWQEAEIAEFKAVDVAMTRDMCREVMGMRVDEVIRHWQQKLGWDTSRVSPQVLKENILQHLFVLIRTKGELLPGVMAALSSVRQLGLTPALASSSDYRVIDAVLDKFALRPFFTVIHSAEDEALGKPHPAVYLRTAEKLLLPPETCLAVEDSLNGLKSAKAAGMTCVVIPEKGIANQSGFSTADYRFSTLEQFAENLEWIVENEARRVG